MTDRVVRRRLDKDSNLVAVFDEAAVDLPKLGIYDLSTLCGKLLKEFEDVLQTDVSNIETSEVDIFDDLLVLLGNWVAGGMGPFPGVSAKRAERWSVYNDCEKWIYYTVHLMNKTLTWNEEGSSFLNTCWSDSYAQVTYILSLAKRWNESTTNGTRLSIKLVAYASLEHVWFGYVKPDSEGSASVVQMSIDESEEVVGGLIVNRLETTAEYDDFASIAHQNTLASETEGSVLANPLDERDFSFILLAKLFQRMLEVFERVQVCIELNKPFVEESLISFNAYLWKAYSTLSSFPRSETLNIHAHYLLAKLLIALPAAPEGQTIEFANEYTALGAVLRLNPAHYLARQCLIEAYLRLGENFLAHQHCLHLLDQLAAHVEDDAEVGVPLAMAAHATAAELLDTGLSDIHQLHLRGEEGYERLDCILNVGDKIFVEWALDDELVLYQGVIDLHGDRASLCISYEDDTEHGQHRRRVENALHLVNINDPSDPYLERYFMNEPIDDDADAADSSEQKD